MYELQDVNHRVCFPVGFNLTRWWMAFFGLDATC